MAIVKRILVVCGTGIATAALVAEKIQSALAERAITVKTFVCHADDAAQMAQEFRPDCVVSTTYLDGTLALPVFRGLPFLTGVKEDEVLAELTAYLTQPAQPSA